jgi:predicted regulator of Ras-like GTPase activity (Roadblock/LC7/MglB family)
MDSVINALRLGVADYLKKPFSIDEVTSVVEREIAKSKGRQVAPATAKPAEKPPRLYIFSQRDLEQIEAVLSRLRAQATAESAMLVEQAGYVIAAKGMSSGADIEPLSNLIASSRSTSASLASLLGEAQDFSTSYMEGQRVSVYTTALGRGLYLAVIVPKGTKQGLVWLYAKEAAVEIDRFVQRASEAMQKLQPRRPHHGCRGAAQRDGRSESGKRLSDGARRPSTAASGAARAALQRLDISFRRIDRSLT